MTFLECDLEDIIANTPQELLINRGLLCLCYDRIYRQVDLGEYGRADLITVFQYNQTEKGEKRLILITIYELKQQVIDVNTLLQAGKYLAAVKIIVEHISQAHDLSKTEFGYKIVLIGRELKTTSSFAFIADGTPLVDLYTYSYLVDGIAFERRQGFRLRNSNIETKARHFRDDWVFHLKSSRINNHFPF